MDKCIYKITNRINNKVYIGQTGNLERRWKEHCRDANKKNTENRPLYRAIKNMELVIFIYPF